MTLLQAFLLALFGWMGSIYSPVLIGGLGGWYTMNCAPKLGRDK